MQKTFSTITSLDGALLDGVFRRPVPTCNLPSLFQTTTTLPIDAVSLVVA
jgi:hypothetical protein